MSGYVKENKFWKEILCLEMERRKRGMRWGEFVVESKENMVEVKREA